MSEVEAWVAKRAASFPNPVKPGMTFRNDKTGDIGEIVTLPAGVQTSYVVKLHADGKAIGDKKIGLAELKTQWEYLKEV